MKILNKYPLFINGQDVIGESTFETKNPYNLNLLANICIATKENIDSAVDAAKIAQKKWAKYPVKEKSNILRKIAIALRENNDELALIDTLDTGRPLSETNCVDIISGAECFEYFASLIEVQSTRFIDLGNNTFAYTKKVPLGIVGAIGAWNYPAQIACWKSAPALATGNAIIFKPSEKTPMSAYHLALLFKKAGLPDGLFQVIQGDGSVGKMLIEHKDIKKVSLTGSVPTGIKIFESCAKHLKKLSLELGGKSPLIINKDANLEEAVEAAMYANFYSQGEICSNGTRVFVHSEIKDEFLKMFKSRAQGLTLGDPSDLSTNVGPMIDPAHTQRVFEYIKIAKEEGAKVLFGGEITGENKNFITPTIIDSTDEMKHVKEEIFGPVASILTFSEIDDAVKRANNSEFGLAAAIFTRDINLAHNIADQLESGIVWINNYNITPIEVPFGGSKMSGIGRENGIEALENYTETKTIYVEGQSIPKMY